MKNLDEEIRGFILDTKNESAEEIKFCNNVSEMKRLTGLDYVKIPTIIIGGKKYKIIMNDDKDSQLKWTCMDKDGKCAVRGSCIVTGFTDTSKGVMLSSLAPEDVENIIDNLGLMLITPSNGGSKYNMYCICNVEVIP